ncbi:class I SAM-dependent methyltransferase [Solicola gregarius]|uniref:Class I SAM-dependent methyltransferase n=1 Tax=Solicola gregarius TaxID=2908642 RepID=A0AA46TJQ2_9ACTN|nr:class I SAM-dependent methyltransferase [Solicola gregarius]UYM06531.1 class I SAM-dependent methyltransferase [Solicola gregarius]
MTLAQSGSASLEQPDYWWYRARRDLLEATLASYLPESATVLDVGSADGPSVDWMRGPQRRVVTLDLLPDGLTPGEGVCGSLEALPFADAAFDVVAGFDVVEHCESEATALSELARVLTAGGRMLLSVPAYQWAWSDHDVRAGHYRRYTRRRLVDAVERAGLTVDRATYAFGAVFPLFLAERGVRRVRRQLGKASNARLTQVSPTMDRVLMGLSRAERSVLASTNVPFGSSVFLAATMPAQTYPTQG